MRRPWPPIGAGIERLAAQPLAERPGPWLDVRPRGGQRRCAMPGGGAERPGLSSVLARCSVARPRLDQAHAGRSAHPDGCTSADAGPAGSRPRSGPGPAPASASARRKPSGGRAAIQAFFHARSDDALQQRARRDDGAGAEDHRRAAPSIISLISLAEAIAEPCRVLTALQRPRPRRWRGLRAMSAGHVAAAPPEEFPHARQAAGDIRPRRPNRRPCGCRPRPGSI